MEFYSFLTYNDTSKKLYDFVTKNMTESLKQYTMIVVMFSLKPTATVIALICLTNITCSKDTKYANFGCFFDSRYFR